ncbi:MULTISPECIES: sn-glycerol-3-phosphate ABC transporter ATP-binding protein UgpC [unclassified Bradyrhizobium]|uniref:ABC transporter ATP-binding protein n=1 Tax=unclassified Bradyrhizobium TaxID=2631580 RepID=UPI00247A169A|nr:MULTISPECIES: sn-glycerol-3-phosphate ABC transporter ATP-binding protein UgpC [unclassified Bradyrhizobium]WGS22976.1 sn-glycerol-3-phosphate ABC transporter ATP-binding protein UgpC [Bradyrhizobium sp. ISRA463]WGS29977.1 sn-glycerol-3-phosphate ABC transporter ATP-binding protein UgpC [Bradyrhizobium sp. ISRA464]
MAQVVLEEVNKEYGSVRAVVDVNLTVADEEFVVLVGPSGCGKSTTLRMVAGLEEITRGVIRIGERVVNRLPPRDRDIAMVFQNYALYQHMTAYDNLAFGLRNRKVPEADITKEVMRAAAVLGIEQLLSRKPRELSGGQQQRVALGRCMVRHPQVFLFDEPLSNLDAKLRAQMRIELKRLRERVATTSIFVTHDQVEAMTLGDRVVVMLDGRIQQAATPLEIYNRPCNRFVAGFIGAPAMNFLSVELQNIDDRLHAVAENFRIRVPQDRVGELARRRAPDVVLGVRPEHVLMGEPRPEHGTGFDACVEVTEQLGAELLVAVRAAGATVLASRIDAETMLALHQPLRLSLDPRGLHFFDRESGEAIR